jgi:hypothetical protein
VAGILDLTPIDITRPALLPEWAQFSIQIGGRLVHESPDWIVDGSYSQTLHLDTGVLSTNYEVDTGIGRWRLSVDWLISRAGADIALSTIAITSLDGGVVDISFGILQNIEPPRYAFRTLKEVPSEFGGGFHEQRMKYRWHPGHMNIVHCGADAKLGEVWCSAVAAGDGPACGIGSAVWCSVQLSWRESSTETEASLRSEYTFLPGQTVVLHRYTAISRDAKPERLWKMAIDTARSARSVGAEQLYDEHCDAWRELWEADIIIDGDELLQKQLRTDLFYLLQSRSNDPRWSMPIFGAASSGYNGGIFWDADVFMFPAILPLQPDFARGMVDFRHRTLDRAKRRASENGFSGAKFAWESELLNGEENIAPVDSILGSGQIHNNAGIALAQWMYYCCTGDSIWLRSHGYPVISAVADFWCDRVTWNEREGYFELLNVFSVEESNGIVDNCAYTNAAAVRSLQAATAAANVLCFSPNPIWDVVANAMYIPRNSVTGLHCADSRSEGPSLWSSTLMHHPLEWSASAKERQECLLDPYFWDMSLQAVVAAMCADGSKMREYLDAQNTRFVHAPFGVRGEQADNDAVPMHTGCGCHLQAWLYGSTGLRWRYSGLEPIYDPCLPDGINSVSFKRLQWHGQSWFVRVDASGLHINPYNPLPILDES